MKKFLVLLGIGVYVSAATTAHAATDDWKRKLQKATDEYFDQVYFHYGPTNATATGHHELDGQLEDYSRKNMDAEIAALKAFEQRIEAIEPDDDASDFVARTDREIVLANIRSTLLTVETIRPWEKMRMGIRAFAPARHLC